MGILSRQRVAVRVKQLTSHPEVNQENTTTFESKNQILAAAVERRGQRGRLLGLGGDLGQRLAGTDAVAALAEAHDPDGMVDPVALRLASCAQVQGRFADANGLERRHETVPGRL